MLRQGSRAKTDSQLYRVLVNVGPERLEETDVKGVIGAIGLASASTPPAPSKTPGPEELFWAALFAQERGGPWRERLGGMMANSMSGAVPRAMRWLAEWDRFDEKTGLLIVSSCPEHPDLGLVWSKLAARSRIEAKRQAYPLSAPKWLFDDPQRKAISEHTELSIDRSYLTASEVDRLVTREPEHYVTKCRYLQNLPLWPEQWPRLKAKLEDWTCRQAVGDADALLQDRAAGRISQDAFLRAVGKWRQQWPPELEPAVLSHYLRQGPEPSTAPEVVAWLEAWAGDSVGHWLAGPSPAGSGRPPMPPPVRQARPGEFVRHAVHHGRRKAPAAESVREVLSSLPPWSDRYPQVRQLAKELELILMPAASRPAGGTILVLCQPSIDG